ncbi:MAG: hypothetical protein FJW95_06525 [Actinobacteria bacterium]|nr:hypothetical protein [Actinomycetota bacterium]
MDVAAAQVRLDEASAAIVAGVARTLPDWIESRVAFIADAWGRLDDATRDALDLAAREVAGSASARVVADLQALFAADAAAQRSTPLEVVRSATADVSALLASVGIPPVERDAFAERAFPEDVYGITPASLADLGDDALGPLQLAWGLAKTQVLRATL